MRPLAHPVTPQQTSVELCHSTGITALLTLIDLAVGRWWAVPSRTCRRRFEFVSWRPEPRKRNLLSTQLAQIPRKTGFRRRRRVALLQTPADVPIPSEKAKVLGRHHAPHIDRSCVGRWWVPSLLSSGPEGDLRRHAMVRFSPTGYSATPEEYANVSVSVHSAVTPLARESTPARGFCLGNFRGFRALRTARIWAQPMSAACRSFSAIWLRPAAALGCVL